MTLEKLTPVQRALRATCLLPAHQARQVLMMICQGGMTIPEVKQPTPGEIHYGKRSKLIQRAKDSLDRVCDYARHETLRNTEKHFRQNPPLKTAAEKGEEPKASSLAARLTFKRPTFSEELLAALREEGATALGVAGQQLFDEIGRDDPWKLPGKAATAFLDARANLLANVPDEIHAEVMDTIQEGLNAGDSRRELMQRIQQTFDANKARSETIANTETAAAFNFARDKAMREAGVTHKKWLHSQSPLIKEPRETHVEADGQIQPIDTPFDVGGVLFMHPADGSLGAGPEDIISCHCVSIPVEAPIESGDKPGQ